MNNSYLNEPSCSSFNELQLDDEIIHFSIDVNNEIMTKNEENKFYDNLIREKYINYYLNYTKTLDSEVNCTYICKNFLKPKYKHLPFLKNIFLELLKRDESAIDKEKIPYDVKRLLYYQSIKKKNEIKKEIFNENEGSGSDSESYEDSTYDDDNMSLDLNNNIKLEDDNNVIIQTTTRNNKQDILKLI